MPRRIRTKLLELSDATGGIAVLASGVRVYWAACLGPRLVARHPDGTTEVVPTDRPGLIHDAFVELCDRGAVVSRALSTREARELDAVIRTHGNDDNQPGKNEAGNSEPKKSKRPKAAGTVFRVFP